MVYFMCDVCASTLKKNQVKSHFSQCKSRSFSCVDCSKSMTGQELENHTICKSEAEKYFGKFYEGKSKQEVKNVNGNDEKKLETNGKDQKSVKMIEKKEEIEKWKGWKNEIKRVLKAERDGIEERKLKKVVVKRFEKCFGRKDVEDVFEKKVKFRRFVEKDDKIYYYRFLRGEE